MIYKAENIDTDKFLKQIDFLVDWDATNKSKEITGVEQYHEGYRKALYDIKNMFYCSNYEKEEKVEKLESNN